MQQFRPKRVRASLPVEIYAAPFQPPLRMQVDNISSGGLFIKTSLGFHVGEVILCKLRLPNMDKPCTFISRVARSAVPGEDLIDDNTGLGLQFLHGSDIRRQQLIDFVYSKEMLESSRNDLRKRHLPHWEDDEEPSRNAVTGKPHTTVV